LENETTSADLSITHRQLREQERTQSRERSLSIDRSIDRFFEEGFVVVVVWLPLLPAPLVLAATFFLVMATHTVFWVRPEQTGA